MMTLSCLGVLGWAIGKLIRKRPHGYPHSEADREDYRGSKGESAVLVCPICKLEFASQDLFDDHWNATHVDPDSFYIPQ